MKLKLQFFMAIASLVLMGNAVAQSITVPTETVNKGDSAVVVLTYTAGGATTSFDFAMAYDPAIVDETAITADCAAATSLGFAFFTCTVNTDADEIRGIGTTIPAAEVSSGTVATITLPTFAGAAAGDSVQPFTGNWSASGTVTPFTSSWTLTVNKAEQVITDFTADPPLGIVGGTSTLSATASSGLPVTFGSNTTSVCTVTGDVVSFLIAGVCTVTADQAGDDTYNPAQQVTLDITGDKVDQTITGLAANPDPGEVNGTSALSATADSGLAVTFGSSTPDVCTVSGSTASYVAAGTCTVTADQAGDAVYNPATQVTLNITVNKIDQTITGLAAAPDPGVVDGTSTLSATASSALAVTFGSSTPAVCTVAGSTVTYVAAGTCTVTADQAGDDDYNAAQQVTLGITVNKADQTITGLAANPSPGMVDETSTLSATASSGLAITFGASTTPAICSVSANVVTYLAVGTCTIEADQAGDANYNAATQVTLGVTVNPGDQAITNFRADPDGGGIDDTSTLSATGGNSTSPVIFASITTGVCTVSGNVVTYIDTGTCTVTANQAADANYNAAPQLTLDLTVSDATSIPTLSQWGLISMFLIMLGLGGMVIRRRDMLN